VSELLLRRTHERVVSSGRSGRLPRVRDDRRQSNPGHSLDGRRCADQQTAAEHAVPTRARVRGVVPRKPGRAGTDGGVR